MEPTVEMYRSKFFTNYRSIGDNENLFVVYNEIGMNELMLKVGQDIQLPSVYGWPATVIIAEGRFISSLSEKEIKLKEFPPIWDPEVTDEEILEYYGEVPDVFELRKNITARVNLWWRARYLNW